MVTDTDSFSLLVDRGASGHYLNSDLIMDLDHILDSYTVIDNPIKIVGAGGHEVYGVGEGIIALLAPDVNGAERRVRFKCTTVPGLGRHLFSTDAAQRKGANTRIPDHPRIELPSTTDEPEFELELRKEGTLYYILWMSRSSTRGNMPKDFPRKTTSTLQTHTRSRARSRSIYGTGAWHIAMKEY